MRNHPRRILILAGWCAFAPLALEAAREPLQDLRWTGSAALWAAAYALREGRRFREGTPALWSCAAQGAASVVVVITGPRAAHHAALIAVTAAEVADLLAVHLAFAAAGAMSVVALAALLAQRRLQPAHLAAVAAFPLFAAGAATLERRERQARAELSEAHDRLAATMDKLAETTRQNERLRISRDLHDGVGHHLVALVFQVEQTLRSAPPEVRPMLEPVSDQARAALQEARRAARGLRRNRSDLPGALVELSESLRVLRLHVAAEASLRVPDEIGEAAFRCAQEIVTNALKHGRARNVWLAVERKGAGLELRARDDGEAQGPSAGAGDLRALRERVSELGGSVQARRSEGGFEVSVSIPLEGRA